MSDLSSADESDDGPSNKISMDQMKAGMQNMKLQDKCEVCGKMVFQSSHIMVDKSMLHPLCLKCSQCGFALTLKTFKKHEGKYYCGPHYPKAKATQVMDQTTALGVNAISARTPGFETFRKADPKMLAEEADMQKTVAANTDTWESRRKAKLEAEKAKMEADAAAAEAASKDSAATREADRERERARREAEREKELQKIREEEDRNAAAIKSKIAEENERDMQQRKAANEQFRAQFSQQQEAYSSPAPQSAPRPTPSALPPRSNPPASGPPPGAAPSRGPPPSGGPPSGAAPPRGPPPGGPAPGGPPSGAAPPRGPPPGGPPSRGPPPGAPPPRAAPPGPKWSVGQGGLLAMWQDGNFYPASVDAFDGSTYTVTYTEYQEQAAGLTEEQIREA